MNVKCAYTESVPLHKLVEHPRNNNKHPEKQIERLAQIIDFQGMRSPIVVSKLSGFITKGHGRLEALKLLGWEEAPVDYQDYENEAQEFADITADNEIARWAELDQEKLLADLEGLDIDVDLLGIEDFKIPEIEVLEPLTDEDDVPEVKESRVKRGDIWKLGNHRVMCGDSTMIDDVEKLMNGEKADFGFCDPPYNLGFKYNSYDDNKSDDEYLEFTNMWFSNLQQFTERQAVTLGTKNIGVMAGLCKIAGVGCWVKKNWITSCHIAKLQQWEPIFFYGDYTKFKRYSDLYEINRVIQKDVGDSHTCPKQISLIEDIFKHYSTESVLDLFLGSGTSTIACEKTNRKCYGMELDEYYCGVIIERWQNFTGRDAILESTGQTYNELLQSNQGE